MIIQKPILFYFCKESPKSRNYTGTPNPDIRILCTLWEECKEKTIAPQKLTKALMWYFSLPINKLIYQVRANTYDFWLPGQYGKFNSNIFLFHPLGPFPSKMMRCPLILCVDFLQLHYTDLTHEIWRSWSIYFLP